MEELKNGAQVLLRGENTHQDGVVLAISGRDFVTWAIDKAGDCFWGHYYPRTFEGLQDAVMDYRHRIEHNHPLTPLTGGQQP